MAEEAFTIELLPGDETLLQRLRRIEGQVRGLQRMVTEQRDCHEVITQLLTVRSALDQVGLMLLNDQLDRCLPTTDQMSEADLDRLRRTLNLWTRFGS